MKTEELLLDKQRERNEKVHCRHTHHLLIQVLALNK